MRGEKGLELPLGVQGGGGQQPGVDAHCDLMHDACRVGDAVGGLQDGPRGSRGGQQVGHRCGGDQGTRRGVGQQGGLGVRVAPKVGVGARSVVWAAVGQGKCVPMHGGGDISLWSPVGKVAVPFLMAGTEMLHLEERRGI